MYCKTSSSTTARRRGATDNQAATLYFYPLSSLRAATISHSPKRQRGDEFTGPTVPALTLGAMWPPRNTANSFRLRLCRYAGQQDGILRPVVNGLFAAEQCARRAR